MVACETNNPSTLMNRFNEFDPDGKYSTELVVVIETEALLEQREGNAADSRPHDLRFVLEVGLCTGDTG